VPILKAEHSITSLSEWERYAPPKAAHHWKDGRSAKEVARAWLEDAKNMPREVLAALAGHRDFGAVLSWTAEPEAKLRFDGLRGEPRNSDLLVLAKDAHGQYLIAVEAKADESYGETVAGATAAARKRLERNPRSNGIARIDALKRLLLHEGTPTEALRYQLLTATAGALMEAKRRGLSRAVLLIHEFVTSATFDAKHERNARDLSAFLVSLSGLSSNGIVNSQLYGPFERDSLVGIRLYVGKVLRRLRS
jgi:hypothetical protein